METFRNESSTVGVATLHRPFLSNFHPAMSLRSIFAGILVALLVFGTVMSLGIALGGVGLANGLSGNGGAYSALWIAFSVIVGLFASSYLAARLSNFSSRRVGSAQGLIVAAAFFGIIGWQAAGLFGWAASGVGSMVGGAAQMAAPAAGTLAMNNSNIFGELIEDTLGDVRFDANPQAIAGGIANRLVRGDVAGAKAYLARHSNLTAPEVDARMMELQGRIDNALNETRAAAAKALQATGWGLFAMFALGILASVLGGALGSRVNIRTPMVAEEPVTTTAPTTTAYAS